MRAGSSTSPFLFVCVYMDMGGWWGGRGGFAALRFGAGAGLISRRRIKLIREVGNPLRGRSSRPGRGGAFEFGRRVPVSRERQKGDLVCVFFYRLCSVLSSICILLLWHSLHLRVALPGARLAFSWRWPARATSCKSCTNGRARRAQPGVIWTGGVDARAGSPMAYVGPGRLL